MCSEIESRVDNSGSDGKSRASYLQATMSTQTPVSAILKLRDPMEQSSEIDHGTTAGSRTLSRENLPLSSKEEQEHPSMRPVMLGNTTSRSQQHVTKIPLHDDQDKSRPWKERRSLREKDYVRNSFTVESRFRRWRQQGVGERSKMGGGELPDQLHEVSEQARSEFRQTGDENANMGALAGLGSSCPWRTLNDEVHRLAIGGSGGPRETKGRLNACRRCLGADTYMFNHFLGP